MNKDQIRISSIEMIRNGEMYIWVNHDEIHSKVSMEMLHEVIKRIFPKDQVEINEDTFDGSVSITGKPGNPDFFCTIRGAKEKITLREIHREIFYQSPFSDSLFINTLKIDAEDIRRIFFEKYKGK